MRSDGANPDSTLDRPVGPKTGSGRTGFARDVFSIPADFDRMAEDEITAQFEGRDAASK